MCHRSREPGVENIDRIAGKGLLRRRGAGISAAEHQLAEDGRRGTSRDVILRRCAGDLKGAALADDCDPRVGVACVGKLHGAGETGGGTQHVVGGVTYQHRAHIGGQQRSGYGHDRSRSIVNPQP